MKGSTRLRAAWARPEFKTGAALMLSVVLACCTTTGIVVTVLSLGLFVAAGIAVHQRDLGYVRRAAEREVSAAHTANPFRQQMVAITLLLWADVLTNLEFQVLSESPTQWPGKVFNLLAIAAFYVAVALIIGSVFHSKKGTPVGGDPPAAA